MILVYGIAKFSNDLGIRPRCLAHTSNAPVSAPNQESGTKQDSGDPGYWRSLNVGANANLSLFLLLCLVIICGVSDAQTSQFGPPASYSTGGTVNSVTVADVNGDGNLDLVVANYNCVGSAGSGCYSTIGVLLGNGDGTFKSAVLYNSGSQGATNVAVADVNGDGKPDLLVANTCVAIGNCYYGGVAVLLGNGDGTFQAPVSYRSGGVSTNSVTVADINGDGLLDVVVANICGNTFCNSSTVSVLLGNGDGTFQSAVSYNSGGYVANSLAVADVNGDGKPDVIVVNSCGAVTQCGVSGGAPGSVGVLLGNGDGTFQSAITYPSAGQNASFVAATDVNGDGKPDLIVANWCALGGDCSNATTGAAGTLSVLMGNGDGTFQTAVPYDSGGLYAWSVAVGDVNGDGIPDLLAANGCVCATGGSRLNGTIGVLLGNGDGTFQKAVAYSLGGGPNSVATADVNRDGTLDLLATSDVSNVVYVLPNTGSSTSGTGTIIVTTNSSAATFTLTGPATFSGSGTTATFSNEPAGTYSISFGAVNCEVSPSEPSELLSVGGTVKFNGNYTPAPPVLLASSPSLTFQYQTGTGSSVSPQAFSISSTCSPVSVSVPPTEANWISNSEPTGPTPANVTVSIAPGLPPGTYSQPILISSSSASNSPLSIPVTLTVTSGPLAQLVFPVQQDTHCVGGTCTPYTTNFETAFDHAMQTAYENKYQKIKGKCVVKPSTPPGYGTITDFENETGSSIASPDGYAICYGLHGYTNASASSFLSGVNYINSNPYDSNHYLYYDGHPGYDYPFAYGTPVFPAVSGCVTYNLSSANASPASDYHTLAIIPQASQPTGGCEHIVKGRMTYAPSSTGYVVFYLHLASYPDPNGKISYCKTPVKGGTACAVKVKCQNCAAEGQWVSANGTQPIAYVGNFDITWGGVGPHLHFEVDRDSVPGQSTPMRLDPYGWWSAAQDPYTGFTGLVNTWLWK